LQDRENKIKNNRQGNLEILYNDDDGWEELENQ
jgi:hypothetical protein